MAQPGWGEPVAWHKPGHAAAVGRSWAGGQLHHPGRPPAVPARSHHGSAAVRPRSPPAPRRPGCVKRTNGPRLPAAVRGRRTLNVAPGTAAGGRPAALQRAGPSHGRVPASPPGRRCAGAGDGQPPRGCQPRRRLWSQHCRPWRVFERGRADVPPLPRALHRRARCDRTQAGTGYSRGDRTPGGRGERFRRTPPRIHGRLASRMSSQAALLSTRPQGDRDPLVVRLRATGRRVHAAPTVAIEPVVFESPDLAQFDWVVVTSGAGAQALVERSTGQTSARWAAVGPRTASVLAALGIHPAAIPDESRGLRIADAIGLLGPLTGLRVLLARADSAAPDLPAALRGSGALVTELAVYHTVIGP